MTMCIIAGHSVSRAAGGMGHRGHQSLQKGKPEKVGSEPEIVESLLDLDERRLDIEKSEVTHGKSDPDIVDSEATFVGGWRGSLVG